MDFFSIKCFVSVARTKNFTEAANQNYITQPAISRKIQELESRLGVKLIYRTSRSVELTDEGKEFLEYAEQLLNDEIEIRKKLFSMKNGNIGYIRIALLNDSSFILAECLKEFSARFPALLFTIDRLQGKELTEAIQNADRYDFFFGTTDSFSGTKGFSCIETEESYFVFAINEADVNKVDITDPTTFRTLSFSFIPRDVAPIYYDKIMAFCGVIGLNPSSFHYFNNNEAIMIAVEAGIGFSILLEDGAKATKMDHVVLLPIKTEIPAHMRVVAWREHMLINNAKRFAGFLREKYSGKDHKSYYT